jgi:hypothetical protein
METFRLASKPDTVPKHSRQTWSAEQTRKTCDVPLASSHSHKIRCDMGFLGVWCSKCDNSGLACKISKQETVPVSLFKPLNSSDSLCSHQRSNRARCSMSMILENGSIDATTLKFCWSQNSGRSHSRVELQNRASLCREAW